MPVHKKKNTTPSKGNGATSNITSPEQLHAAMESLAGWRKQEALNGDDASTMPVEGFTDEPKQLTD